MNKKTIVNFIIEVLVTAFFYGGLSWSYEWIVGNTDVSVGNFALRGLIFGVVFVPINRWLRKRERETGEKEWKAIFPSKTE